MADETAIRAAIHDLRAKMQSVVNLCFVEAGAERIHQTVMEMSQRLDDLAVALKQPD